MCPIERPGAERSLSQPLLFNDKAPDFRTRTGSPGSPLLIFLVNCEKPVRLFYSKYNKALGSKEILESARGQSYAILAADE